MNLIFILLQPDQPPAADAHNEECQDASKHHSRKEGALSASGQSHEDSTPRSCDQHNCKGEMTLPGASPKLAAKDGKEAENLDREEG